MLVFMDFKKKHLHPAASGAFCNEAASNSTYLQHLGSRRYLVVDVGWLIFFVPTRNHQLWQIGQR